MKYIFTVLFCLICSYCSTIIAQNIDREDISLNFVRLPLKNLPDSTETYTVQLTSHQTESGNNFYMSYDADRVVLNGYYRLDNVYDADIIIASDVRSDLVVTNVTAESGTYKYKKDKNSPEIEYTAYVYKISYRNPQLYYSVKTGNGFKIEDGLIGGMGQMQIFGNTTYDSHYSSEYQLEAAWREAKPYNLREWENNGFTADFSYLLQLNTIYCLHRWNYSFTIKYVKEKKENKYQDLLDAKEKFMEAVRYMREDSIYLINKLIQPDYDKQTELIKEAIAIWEKALTESDLNNKKARIDQKVTRHIYFNLSAAYLLLNDFDKAQQYIQGREDDETKDLVLKNAFAGLKSMSAFIDDQKKRYEANLWRKPLTSIDSVFVYKTPAEKMKEKQDQEMKQLAEAKRIQDSADAASKVKKATVSKKKTSTPVKKTTKKP